MILDYDYSISYYHIFALIDHQNMAAFQSNGLGFWFACAWFPFLLGVGLLAFAWNSRTSPWIHIRIDQKTGKSPQRIAFSLPIPIRREL